MQVFATDIDSHVIAAARAGLYPTSSAADLTPERLNRFFSPEPGGFLLLGTSETEGEFGDLFSALDRKLKVYQRKEDLFGARIRVGFCRP